MKNKFFSTIARLNRFECITIDAIDLKCNNDHHNEMEYFHGFHDDGISYRFDHLFSAKYQLFKPDSEL